MLDKHCVRERGRCRGKQKEREEGGGELKQKPKWEKMKIKWNLYKAKSDRLCCTWCTVSTGSGRTRDAQHSGTNREKSARAL